MTDSKSLLKPADERGLNLRYLAVVLLVSLLCGYAAFSGGAGFFRDTQALLVMGALSATVLAASVGAVLRVRAAHIAFFVLVLIYCASTATSRWWADSLLETGLFAGYLAIFFLASNVIGKARRGVAMHALVAVGVAVSAAALYDFFISNASQIVQLRALGYVEQADQLAVMSGQVFGKFPSANALAGWLVLLVPVSLGLFFSESDYRVKSWSAFAAALMSVALYFTFSRAAVLALVCAVALAAVLWAGRSRSLRRAILPVLFSLSAAIAALMWGLFRFNAETFSNTFAGRLELWRAGVAMAVDNPLLGVGPFSFGPALLKYQIGSAYSRYAHNSFIQVAAEVGWPGLVVLLAVFAFAGALAVRLYKKADDRLAWQHLGLITGAAAVVIHNALDYSWYIPAVGLAFWWVVGLAIGDDDSAPTTGALASTARSIGVLAVLAAVLPFTAVVFAQSMTSSAKSGYNHYLVSHVARSGGRRALGSVPSINGGSKQGRGVDREGAQGSEHDVAGEVLVVRERFADAKRYFPYDSNTYDAEAAILYNEIIGGRGGSLSEAAALQRKAISLRPTWPFYHLRLARIYAAAGKAQDARAEYTRAAELGPKDPSFFAEFGYFLLGLGQPAAALGEFEKATALGKIYDRDYTSLDLQGARGDQSRPLESIGGAYIGAAYSQVQLKEHVKAQSALREAERLLGRTAGVLTAKGRLREEKGDYRGAIEAFRAAYRRSARDNETFPGIKAEPAPEIIVRLASVLEKSGDKRAALALAREALAADPRQPEAGAIIKRLKAD